MLQNEVKKLLAYGDNVRKKMMKDLLYGKKETERHTDWADKFIKTVVYPEYGAIFHHKPNGVMFSMSMSKLFCELHGVKATYDYINKTVEFEKPLGG